jgi:hypothetical protein
MLSKYIGASPVASSVPYDPTQSGLDGYTVQQAIDLLAVGTEPLPNASQLIWVDQGGNDSTGDGTLGNPYFTIAHAVTTFSDSSITKSYLILVGPGTYSAAFNLPPWVTIHGLPTGQQYVFISGAVTIPSTWTGGSDFRSGFDNIKFSVAQTWDFSAVTSTAGKLYIYDCQFSSSLTITGYNQINQLVTQSCWFFSGFTQNGVNHYMIDAHVVGGNININSQSTTFAGFLNAYGGASAGSLTATFTTGQSTIALSLYSFVITGGLSLSGSGVSTSTTSDSIVGVVSLSNSAPAPVLLTPATAMSYVAATLANWGGTTPTSVSNALDLIGNKIGGMPSLSVVAIPTQELLYSSTEPIDTQEWESTQANYTATYTGSLLTQEQWKNNSNTNLLKQITYTYTGNQLTTEVRNVYGSNGSTIIAQVTLAYTYTGSKLTSNTIVRNV